MKTGRCKYRWNPWKNTPVGWTCHHSQFLINGLLMYSTNANKNVHCITFWQVQTKIHNVPRLGYLTDIQCSVAPRVLDCRKQKGLSMMIFSNTNRNTHCSRTFMCTWRQQQHEVFHNLTSLLQEPFPIRYITQMWVRFSTVTELWVFEIGAQFT